MKGRILVFIAGAILTAAAAYAFEDGDFQIWHTQAQDIRICEDAKATLEEEFRYGGNASELFYHHYDFGLVLGLNKHLDLGAFYRLVYDKKNGKFKQEDRPHLDLTVKYNLWGFKIEDRNRFEYRHFRYQNDQYRYRNKASIKYPIKFSSFNVYPFISDEVFARIDDDGIVSNQNRLAGGIGIDITDDVKGEIYYMLVNAKSKNKWTDSNVLGLKLKVIF